MKAAAMNSKSSGSLLAPRTSNNQDSGPVKSRRNGKGWVHMVNASTGQRDPIYGDAIVVEDHIITVESGGQTYTFPSTSVLYITWE